MVIVIYYTFMKKAIARISLTRVTLRSEHFVGIALLGAPKRVTFHSEHFVGIASLGAHN